MESPLCTCLYLVHDVWVLGKRSRRKSRKLLLIICCWINVQEFVLKKKKKSKRKKKKRKNCQKRRKRPTQKRTVPLVEDKCFQRTISFLQKKKFLSLQITSHPHCDPNSLSLSLSPLSLPPTIYLPRCILTSIPPTLHFIYSVSRTWLSHIVIFFPLVIKMTSCCDFWPRSLLPYSMQPNFSLTRFAPGSKSFVINSLLVQYQKARLSSFEHQNFGLETHWWWWWWWWW